MNPPNASAAVSAASDAAADSAKSAASRIQINPSKQHHLLHVGQDVLTKCIHYLNQPERVSTSRTCRSLFEACCSPSAWPIRTDEEEETFLFDNMKKGKLSVLGLRNGAQLPCVTERFTPACERLPIVPSRIFTNARSMEIHFDLTGEPWNWAAFPKLQHLILNLTGMIKPTQSPPGSGIIIPRKLNPFPSTLKSCVISLPSHKSDCAASLGLFIPLLPASLETLYIWHDVEDVRLRLDLDHLPNLKRFSFLSRNMNYNRPKQPALVWLNLGHMQSLRTVTDIDMDAMLDFDDDEISMPPSPPVLFCATLVHIRLENFERFDDYTEDMNWQALLPRLVSLDVRTFFVAEDVYTLPVSLGTRVHTLVIGSLECFPDPDTQVLNVAKCFAQHGLTNLTSLTIESNYTPGQHILDELVSLTHLAFRMEVEFHDFNDFLPLRSLRTLELINWPIKYMALNPETGGPSEQLNENIQDCLNQSSELVSPSEIPSESLASSFPSLTELTVDKWGIPWFNHARKYLQSIPNLKSARAYGFLWFNPEDLY